MKTAQQLAKPESAGLGRRDETFEAYQAAVERAVIHMRAHFEAPLDLEEIAQTAAISKFHLVRIFDEVTGTTPHHFLACLRMQRAKELLLATDMSITEVCMAVGYSSLGSFSTTFSDLVGLSPQQFRTLPRRLNAIRFTRAIARYLAKRHRVTGEPLEGVVEGPTRPRGFTFVGTFTGGVPQGVPYSGTVLLSRGSFRVKRPDGPEFHVLAVLVPFSAHFTAMMASLPVGLVANLRVQNQPGAPPAKPRLQLRPVRLTDPPIVLALPALPPLRD